MSSNMPDPFSQDGTGSRIMKLVSIVPYYWESQNHGHIYVLPRKWLKSMHKVEIFVSNTQTQTVTMPLTIFFSSKVRPTIATIILTI